MKKFRRAVFCYAFLCAYRLSATQSRRITSKGKPVPSPGEEGPIPHNPGEEGLVLRSLGEEGPVLRSLGEGGWPRIRRGIWRWILTLRGSHKPSDAKTIGTDGREWLADWAVAELFDVQLDFDTVLHILCGDEFFERNRRDVARLERETGRAVQELWDTDQIFTRYPHLRGLARNREFEEMWSKMKQKMK